MKVTIKKIAEIAGVHPATVDKVLHKRPGVSDEVRERVQKLIDELGYKPNPAGRVLQKQGKEFVIAAILVKVDALPYIKAGIEKGIREQTGLDITIHWYLFSYSDAGQQAQFIDKAIEEKADGIILSPINSNRVREAINRAAAAGIPLVTANSDIDGTQRLCYVGQDGRRASRVAARTMGNLLGGSGRIAIISSAIASENNSYHVKVREGCVGAVALAEKFSQATAPKIMLFGVRDASDRCHPAFSAPFVRTLTDILRCLTKCSIRWFDQAKIIRFFSEGKGVFPFSLTVSYGGVC